MDVFPTLSRRLLILSVLLAALAVEPASAQQPVPSGEATMAWHVTIAPSWFDPSTAPPQITPFGMLYAIHDAFVRPFPAPDTAARLRQPRCRAGAVGKGRSLLHWLEIDVRHALPHPASEGEPGLTRAAEVDSSIDARVGTLPGGLRKARERSRDPVERFAAGESEADLIAEDAREDDRRRCAERALRRRVVRDGRRVLMAVPRRIADGGVVAVVVAFADGRDRT